MFNSKSAGNLHGCLALAAALALFSVLTATAHADSADWYSKRFVSFDHRLELILTNPLAIARVREPVVVPVALLTNVADALPILVDPAAAPDDVIGGEKGGADIPCQFDDSDGDGKVDELVFQVDLKPNETRKLFLYYAAGRQAAFRYKPRTRIETAGRLGGAFLDLVAGDRGYRTYVGHGYHKPYAKYATYPGGGGGMYSFYTLDAQAKRSFWLKPAEFTDSPDDKKAGIWQGLGVLRLMAGTQFFAPVYIEGAYRIISQGPVRAGIELIFARWDPVVTQLGEVGRELFNVNILEVHKRIFIYADQPYLEEQVLMKPWQNKEAELVALLGSKESGMDEGMPGLEPDMAKNESALVWGSELQVGGWQVPNGKEPVKKGQIFGGKKEGYVGWCSEGERPVMTGVVFPVEECASIQNIRGNIVPVLKWHEGQFGKEYLVAQSGGAKFVAEDWKKYLEELSLRAGRPIMVALGEKKEQKAQVSKTALREKTFWVINHNVATNSLPCRIMPRAYGYETPAELEAVCQGAAAPVDVFQVDQEAVVFLDPHPGPGRTAKVEVRAAAGGRAKQSGFQVAQEGALTRITAGRADSAEAAKAGCAWTLSAGGLERVAWGGKEIPFSESKLRDTTLEVKAGQVVCLAELVAADKKVKRRYWFYAEHPFWRVDAETNYTVSIKGCPEGQIAHRDQGWPLLASTTNLVRYGLNEFDLFYPDDYARFAIPQAGNLVALPTETGFRISITQKQDEFNLRCVSLADKPVAAGWHNALETTLDGCQAGRYRDKKLGAKAGFLFALGGEADTPQALYAHANELIASVAVEERGYLSRLDLDGDGELDAIFIQDQDGDGPDVSGDRWSFDHDGSIEAVFERPPQAMEGSILGSGALSQGKDAPRLTCFRGQVRPAPAVVCLGSRLITDGEDAEKGGGTCQIYLQNKGTEPVRLFADNTLVDGVPLEVQKKNGNILWWRTEPELLKPGEVATLRMRLKQMEKFGAVLPVTIRDLPRYSTFAAPKRRSLFNFTFVGFDETCKKAWLFARNETDRPLTATTLVVNGVDLTGETVLKGPAVPPGDTMVCEVDLSKKIPGMGPGSDLVFQLSSQDGTMACGQMRAAPARIYTGCWFSGIEMIDDYVQHNLDGVQGRGMDKLWKGKIRDYWAALELQEGGETDEAAADLYSKAASYIKGNEPKETCAWIIQDEPDPGDLSVHEKNKPVHLYSKHPTVVELNRGFEDAGDMADIISCHPKPFGGGGDDNMTGYAGVLEVMGRRHMPKPLWCLPTTMRGARWPSGREEEVIWISLASRLCKGYWIYLYNTLWMQSATMGEGEDFENYASNLTQPGVVYNDNLWHKIGEMAGMLQSLEVPLGVSSLWRRELTPDKVEINTMVCRDDTLIVFFINQDMVSKKDTKGKLLYVAKPDREMTLRIPPWIQPKHTFLFDWRHGLQDLAVKQQGPELLFNPGDLETTRTLIITARDDIRAGIAERWSRRSPWAGKQRPWIANGYDLESGYRLLYASESLQINRLTVEGAQVAVEARSAQKKRAVNGKLYSPDGMLSSRITLTSADGLRWTGSAAIAAAEGEWTLCLTGFDDECRPAPDRVARAFTVGKVAGKSRQWLWRSNVGEPVQTILLNPTDQMILACGRNRAAGIDGEGHKLWERLCSDADRIIHRATGTADGKLLCLISSYYEDQTKFFREPEMLCLDSAGMLRWTVYPKKHVAYRLDGGLSGDGSFVALFGGERGGKVVQDYQGKAESGGIYWQLGSHLWLFDEQGREKKKIKLGTAPYRCVVSEDGQRIAFGHLRGGVGVFSKELNGVGGMGTGGPTIDMKFSRDGSFLVAGSLGIHFSALRGKETWTRMLPKGRPRVRAVAISADGRLIAGGNTDGSFAVFTRDGKELFTKYEPFSRASDIAFSPDGSLVVGGFIRLLAPEESWAFEGVVCGWDMQGKEIFREVLPAAECEENSEVWHNWDFYGKANLPMRFAPDGQKLFAGYYDGNVYCFPMPPASYPVTEEPVVVTMDPAAPVIGTEEWQEVALGVRNGMAKPQQGELRVQLPAGWEMQADAPLTFNLERAGAAERLPLKIRMNKSGLAHLVVDRVVNPSSPGTRFFTYLAVEVRLKGGGAGSKVPLQLPVIADTRGEWLVAGPFKEDSTLIVKSPTPEKVVPWKPVKSDGSFNLDKMLEKKTSAGVCYLLAWVHSSEEKEVQIKAFSSAEPVIAWVNGQEFALGAEDKSALPKATGLLSTTPDEVPDGLEDVIALESGRCTLRKGANRLLLEARRVLPERWLVDVQVLSPQGKPLSDLRWTASAGGELVPAAPKAKPVSGPPEIEELKL